MWSEIWSDFVLKWSETSYGEVLEDKSTCTLGWPYTEGTWFYCDCFIWCVSCNVVVWTGFVMCVGVGFVMCGWVCVCVGVGFVMCGCFGNMCTCIYCVFVLFLLRIFILICFVCTGVRTTATGWQLNWSYNNNNYNNNNNNKYSTPL
jgi:hypothetical protein